MVHSTHFKPSKLMMPLILKLLAADRHENAYQVIYCKQVTFQNNDGHQL